MPINEDYEKRIKSLERRVQVLESIINGTSRNKPGRTSILLADAKSEVIRKHNAGSSYSRLAAEYGVSKTTIYNICHFDKGKNRFTIPVQKNEPSVCQIQGSTVCRRNSTKQEDASLLSERDDTFLSAAFSCIALSPIATLEHFSVFSHLPAQCATLILFLLQQEPFSFISPHRVSPLTMR